MKYSLALGATTVAAAVAVSLLNASPARAQAAPAEPAAGGLEEVVVTARYREENLQQTPIAITAITAEDIQTRGFTSTSDIAYTVPNASFRPAQQAYGNTMTAYIRGVGQNDFNFAFEPGVGIYVDDVYYPTTMASQFDLLDLERVEVLRGPQGTLFGRGSIGGAVRYVSKQPTGDNTGYIEATAGEFHRVDLRAGYDFAMIPDKLFARITGVSKQQDGYQRIIDFACAFPSLAGSLPASTQNRGQDCQTGTLGGTDVRGARAQFRLVASDALEIGMALDYQRDASEARADSLIGIVPPGTSCTAFPAGQCPGGVQWNQAMIAKFGVPYDARFIAPSRFVTYDTFTDPYSGLAFRPKTSLSQKGVSATFNWKVADNWGAKLITAYRDWDGEFATDQDGSPLGYSVVNGFQDFRYKTVELQVSGRAMDRLDWTAGAFYYHGNSQSTQSVELPPFMGPRLSLYLNDPQGITNGLPNSLLVNGLDVGRYENISEFLHGVYALTDDWHLTLGYRHSDDKKHDNFDNSVFRTPVDSNGKRNDWRVGLDYQVTNAVLTYASVSTGYRPPAYNPRPFQPTQFVAVKGENMTAYELGFKSDLFDRKLRANIAGFYSDYKQRIVPAGGVECVKNPDGSVVPGATPNPEGGAPCVALLPKTNYINSPGKIKGGELELDFRPLDGLVVQASAGYTNFSANSSTQGGITANGEPVYVPEWNAAGSIQYTWNLSGGGSISPRYDAYMQTEICSSVTTTTSCSAGYTLHNVRLEYASSERSWTTAVGVSNLTDHEYLLNIFDLTPFGEATIEGQPGMPRTWFVTFRRNFQ
jgi:iron complex outermembrane recepter protein